MFATPIVQPNGISLMRLLRRSAEGCYVAQTAFVLDRSIVAVKVGAMAVRPVRKTVRGRRHREKHPCRPSPGMLLFQDALTLRWIGALDRNLDLEVTLDNATGAIHSAILVEREGKMSNFRGLPETAGACGLFGALHTDRDRITS